MKKWLFLLLPFSVEAQSFSAADVARWQTQAKNVTVIEDDWGVPHIYGKTDADAVFGLLYVQCKQNFARVERNYIEMMGRLSEVEGEEKLYADLQMRLLYDSASAKADYARAPQWFKKLLNAFADGVNYYLHTHPQTKPLVLKKFEPWFPLLYTDGSISPTQTGSLTVAGLRHFYEGGGEPTSLHRTDLALTTFDPNGSNGFALAPSRTASKNAMLYINPHVTFYFRTEAHMVSEEGLNAYGAVTWGQFFIYQGFNEHCGWMHTSSYADVADVYKVKVEKEGSGLVYRFDGSPKTVVQKQMQLSYKKGDAVLQKSFPVYYTLHGPVMGKEGNGAWLALKENNRSMASLQQSWLRTKANGFAAFKKVMEMRANNSNNTVFADAGGNIAYWHGNYMPRRNAKLDWTLPVDGATSATLWSGLHSLQEVLHVYNPKSGFLQNCNSTPFTVAGESSPRPQLYPAYMAPDGENGRGITAVKLLSKTKNATLDDLIAIGYNTYLSAFDVLLPSLFAAYDQLPQTDEQRSRLEKAVHLLRVWDRQSSASSVATTIAVEWAAALAAGLPQPATPEEASRVWQQYHHAATNIAPAKKLAALQATLDRLEKLYGTWAVAWGDVNRFQRTASHPFSDDSVSLPVGLAPATWGALPSFMAARAETKKRYGTRGNSFVAAVEFGKRLRAKSILTGGESFNPASKHFTDQAEGFLTGKFKEVRFYKTDVLKYAQRRYHPGE